MKADLKGVCMDYKVYQITKKEMFRYAAVYILADVLISLLFYRSVLAMEKEMNKPVNTPIVTKPMTADGKEKKKTAGAGISGRDAVCFYRPDGGIFG